MHVALLVFLIFLIVVVIAFFTVLIVNSIRRACETKPQHEEPINKKNKIVDLFVPRYADLPQPSKYNELCGITALIDLGMFNLETGIYMFQYPNEWVHIGFPEVGDRFIILRGKHGKQQHTIRQSFMNEVRPPTETQIISSEDTYQVLQETTSEIYMQDDVKTAAQIAINQNHTHHAQNATTTGRTLKIVNTSSKFPCVLLCKPHFENIVIEPQKIVHVHLKLKCNGNGSYFYEPLAKS